MKDTKRIVLTVLVGLLYEATAWAQEFNPVNPPDPQMLYKVVARATDGHYTSGSGSYTTGTQVTINTSANGTGFDFKHWTKNGEVYTTDKSFTYTVEAMNVNFVAVYEFNPANPQDPQTPNEYRLYLVPDPEGACSFSRTSGAKCEGGTTPTVTAYASQGFVFQGWYNGDEKIGESATLNTFTMPKANTTLTARYTFEPTSPGDPESSQTNVDQGGIEGDANNDGVVNINDVLSVVDFFLGKNPTPFDSKKADVNHDNEININDVLGIIDIILH